MPEEWAMYIWVSLLIHFDDDQNYGDDIAQPAPITDYDFDQ